MKNGSKNGRANGRAQSRAAGKVRVAIVGSAPSQIIVLA